MLRHNYFSILGFEFFISFCSFALSDTNLITLVILEKVFFKAVFICKIDFFEISKTKLEDTINIFPKLSKDVIQEKLKEKDIAGIANTIRKIKVPTYPIVEDK